MSKWMKLSVMERAQILRKFSDDAALQAFITEAAKRIAEPLILPGPTGELNRLSLEARGHFICLDGNTGGAESAFLMHICAALLAGNSVTLIGKQAGPLHAQLTDLGLTDEDISLAPQTELSAALALPGLAGVSFNGASEQARELGRTLAQRDGVIVQLIWNEPLNSALILRFMTEKTVTINTAAIGGNAALLGLGAQ